MTQLSTISAISTSTGSPVEHCLSAVQQWTAIKEDEGLTTAAPKVLFGLVLKVGVITLALIETMARFALLVGGTLLQSETLAQMKQATAAAAKTASDAFRSLSHFRSVANTQVQPSGRLFALLTSAVSAWANHRPLVRTAIGMAGLAILFTFSRTFSKPPLDSTPAPWKYRGGLKAAPICFLGGYLLSLALRTANKCARKDGSINILDMNTPQNDHSTKNLNDDMNRKLYAIAIDPIFLMGSFYIKRLCNVKSFSLDYNYVFNPLLIFLFPIFNKYKKSFVKCINSFENSKVKSTEVVSNKDDSVSKIKKIDLVIAINSTCFNLISLVVVRRIGLLGLGCIKMGYDLHEWQASYNGKLTKVGEQLRKVNSNDVRKYAMGKVKKLFFEFVIIKLMKYVRSYRQK